MFSGLQHMQVDAEEYMVVADWKETLIKVYDKTGKHVRELRRKGQGPGEINVPAYVGIFQGKQDRHQRPAQRQVHLLQPRGRVPQASPEGEIRGHPKVQGGFGREFLRDMGVF